MFPWFPFPFLPMEKVVLKENRGTARLITLSPKVHDLEAVISSFQFTSERDVR